MMWLKNPCLMVWSLTILLSLSAAWSTADEPFRNWTTNDGVRSSTKLKLIEQNETKVVLERQVDGASVTLPISRLSALDQRYLKSVAAKPAVTETASASNTDWPQWRGPDRTGQSQETGLLKQWPNGGPQLSWKVNGLGEGYSSPTIAGGTIYVLGAEGGSEKMFALNEADGSPKWNAPLGSVADGGGYKGPRGSATINGDHAYAIGSDGSIVCVRTTDGSEVWRKNMSRDFGGSPGHWAYAESPLIDGDKLICTPGGSTATMVALNKNTGAVVWKASAGELERVSGDYTKAGYASPIKATIAGTPQYICFLHGGVVAFAAANGSPLWHYEHPANGTANCSTPVVQGDSIFAASGYGTGGGKATITKRGNEWRVSEDFFERKMQSHHGGFVLVDGHIYGANDSVLLCIDMRTGAIKWQDRCVGKGSIAFADGHLYVRSENGPMALVEASPTGYVEKGRFDQPERSGKNAWPHPVIANGKLYLHDQDKLFCYNVK